MSATAVCFLFASVAVSCGFMRRGFPLAGPTGPSTVAVDPEGPRRNVGLGKDVSRTFHHQQFFFTRGEPQNSAMRLRRSLRSAPLFLCFASVPGVAGDCMEHCKKQPCEGLSGNLTAECNDCPESTLCNPSSPDFYTWEQRAALGKDTKGVIIYHVECESWCKEQKCQFLSGNLTAECGACPSTDPCNPVAADYDTWKEREGQLLKGEIVYKVHCLDHCDKSPCTDFFGNLTEECGACPTTTKCNPEGDGYSSWPARAKMQQEL